MATKPLRGTRALAETVLVKFLHVPAWAAQVYNPGDVVALEQNLAGLLAAQGTVLLDADPGSVTGAEPESHVPVVAITAQDLPRSRRR